MSDTPTKKRRDWLILPLVGLATLVVLALGTEGAARLAFPASADGLLTCFVQDNPTGDLPVRPNTTCSEQITESPYVAEYKFNSRGHRAGGELEPKKPGTYRIVLIGSSMTMGLFVPREKTFAALLPEELSQQTGRKIDLYNEAPGGKFRGGTYPTRDSASKFGEVLAAQPDLVLWTITPWDAVNAGYNPDGPVATQPAAQQAAPPAPSGLLGKLEAAWAKGNFAARFNYRWEQTRTSVALKHLLLKNDSQEEYVNSYIGNEGNGGFMRAELGPDWKRQLQYFDADVTEIQAKAKAAGVPFVAVLIPNRAQAAMIANGNWPKGYDPYRLDQELRKVIERNGGTYLDILPYYRNIAAPEQNYFPVDGHPDAKGHAVVAELLTKELTKGVIPALNANPASAQTAEGKGK